MMVYFGMLRQMDRAARLRQVPRTVRKSYVNGLTATVVAYDVRQMAWTILPGRIDTRHHLSRLHTHAWQRKCRSQPTTNRISQTDLAAVQIGKVSHDRQS